MRHPCPVAPCHNSLTSVLVQSSISPEPSGFRVLEAGRSRKSQSGRAVTKPARGLGRAQRVVGAPRWRRPPASRPLYRPPCVVSGHQTGRSPSVRSWALSEMSVAGAKWAVRGLRLRVRFRAKCLQLNLVSQCQVHFAHRTFSAPAIRTGSFSFMSLKRTTAASKSMSPLPSALVSPEPQAPVRVDSRAVL